MENLKLPLCPKCRDTKHVTDLGEMRLSRRMIPIYKCKQCNIEWDVDRILDHGIVHEVDSRSSSLGYFL